MPIGRGTSRARQTCTPIRRWEATRRVAYDADADEDEVRQVTQSSDNPPAPTELAIPIRSTEALAQRLSQNRSRVAHRIGAESSTAKLPETRNPEKQLRRPQHPPAFTNAEAKAKNDQSSSSNAGWFSRDEWITEELDYTSRSRDYNNRQAELAHVQPRKPSGFITHIVYKQKITFMSLPPEVRNTIYDYTIPERSVLITRTRPKREARGKKRCWSDEYAVSQPARSRLTHEPEWNYTSEDFVNAINLLLTCKKVKAEVETFLYSRILFCFHSLKSLRRFLHTASRSGIHSMRRLFIMQDGYGNSYMTVDQKFRERYYRSWENVCTLLGKLAPNLKHLKLKVFDREWPSELSGKGYAPVWKHSILKSAPTLLPKVEVQIHHQMIDQNEEVLRDLARCVENSMMTQEGCNDRDRLETERVLAEINARKAAREERERKKRAKLNAPPPPTELIISMDDIQKQAQKAPLVKKYRSKGLEKYDKIDRSIYSFHVERYD